MPTFDIFVVGSGGGPSEVNLSGYLVKAHDRSWTDGIVGIEAGSGLGALSRILQDNPRLLTAPGEPELSAAQIYSNVRTYLITHAHLDHVLSLVLMAGSVSGPRKSIRGTRECLEDLQTIFKPSRIWPNLASWDKNDSNHLYLYDPLPEPTREPVSTYTPILGKLSTRLMPLCHGHGYTSSAYFIRREPILQANIVNNSSNATTNGIIDLGVREFLLLGDVMPDSLADRPFNAEIWEAAAPKIPHELNTIFIECSWPSGRADSCLYGHLTPEHLVQELENLAVAVVEYRTQRLPPPSLDRQRSTSISSSHPSGPLSDDTAPSRSSKRRASAAAASNPKRTKFQRLADVRGALAGLRVYVMHCKEDMEGKYKRPMHEVITEQVARLAAKKELGVEILAAVQGTIIQI